MLRSGVIAALLVLYGVSCDSKGVGFGPGDQDWGHVTVREGAHMFYWLYYTTAKVANYTERPLTIWLQGGPGASSTGYGNFEELGPLDLDLNPRNHTWVREMNVLFIDNPVGSGFSYVDETKYLTTDNKMIALDLVSLMKKFYNIHPEFKKVPLHIFCESYGGKMAAEFALELDKAIKAKEIDCDLQSVALGDSWVSPMDSVYAWAPLLLNMGIVDHKGSDAITAAARKVDVALKEGRFVQATNLWGQTQGVLLRESKGVDFYNILLKTYSSRSKAGNQDPYTTMFNTLVRHDSSDVRTMNLDDLMRGPVSVALDIPRHVVWGSQSSKTFNALSEDFMKPVIHIVEEVLNTTDIQVVVFTGQLDLICATAGTVVWIDKMKWPLATKYASAPRNGITVEGILEGYTKQVNKFSMYWINRAGHMVPNDNPAGMSYILKQVTKYG